LTVKKIHTDSNAVPQGGRILITLQMEATSCEVVFRQPERLLSPQGLVIDPQSPFRFYPGSTFSNEKRRGTSDDASGAAATTRKLEYRLVIEALPNAAVGKHDLVARVSYQAVDKAGNQSPREQTLSLPITVVPMGTPVQRSPENKFKDVTVKVLVGIALVPLLPLMLLGGIVQYIQHGQWPSC
jgi:hypothetical protein